MTKVLSKDSPNVLFLDIDGVLNSHVWFINRIKSHGDEDDSMRQHKLSMIDPDAVKYLNDFVDETKCKVVLSSTWRLNTPISEMTELLEEKGATFKIDSATISLQDRYSVRGNEILAWIKNHIEDYHEFNRYVIFDDDSDMLLWQVNNFFKCDGHVGLTPRVCYRAARYLSTLK